MKNLSFLVGYVGHKAQAYQELFKEYTVEPNENGYFLKFENTTYIGNKGVMVWTNCFENEEDLQEKINDKMLKFFIENSK